MPVGQIYRNTIEGNSVGVGFYGYSGFSGFSGQAGGFEGLDSGAALWTDDMLVFDSLNGYNTYAADPIAPYWQVFAINDFNTYTGPTANWKSTSAVSGFTTKLRARALLMDGYVESGIGNENSCFWAMRIRKITAISVYNPAPVNWNPDWSAGYADDNVLVLTGYGGTVIFGPLVGEAMSAIWTGRNSFSDAIGEGQGYAISGLETPWATLPGDGNYMVEVMDYHFKSAWWGKGWVPDKVFIQFAEVKD